MPDPRSRFTRDFGHPRRVEWVRYGNEISKLTENLQARATETARRRIHKIEADAKRILEKLEGRAESRLRGVFAHARPATKEKWIHIGSELVKLGEKLQRLATPPIADAVVKSAGTEAPEAKS